MTSAARNKAAQRRGFTILELVVAITIVVLLTGGGLAALHFSRHETKLRDATQEVELLAKRARTAAALQQKPYAVEFREGFVSLMPLSEALVRPDDRESLIEELELREFERQEMAEFSGQTNRRETAPAMRQDWSYNPDEMIVRVMRWATSEWIEINTRNRQVWSFEPDGLCEPIAVRIEVEDSWSAIRFNPLTAAIADEEARIE